MLDPPLIPYLLEQDNNFLRSPPPAQEAKNLGCWFDQQLSMGTQINTICSASYSHFHLHNITCIRKYLSTESTKKLVHTLVTSRIDYCNSLLLCFAANTACPKHSHAPNLHVSHFDHNYIPCAFQDSLAASAI